MRIFFITLLTLVAVSWASEMPANTKRELESLAADLERFKVEYEKKCSDRKTAALARLKAQMSMARGEDVIAIKGAIDELSGEADAGGDLMEPATPKKKPTASKLLVTKAELDEAKKEREIGIENKANEIRNRILTALETAQTVLDFQVALQALKEFAPAAGGNMYPTGRNGATSSWPMAQTEHIAKWCAPDPIARFNALKKNNMVAEVDAGRFIRITFDSIASDTERYKAAVKRFAAAMNDPMFDKFK